MRRCCSSPLVFAVPDWWRLIGVAGVGLLAVFLPYKFMREQQRADRRLAGVRDSVTLQVRSGVSGIERRVDAELKRHSAESAESGHALDDRISSMYEHVTQELAAVRDVTTGVDRRLDELEARLAPSRRFTRATGSESRLVELTMRDATDALRRAPRDSAD